MAGVESRRARKAVNYAELADFTLDDDFADFKTSTKTEKSKDKENFDWQDQEDKRERKHSKDRQKDHKSHRDKDRHRDNKDRHRDNKDRHRDDKDRHRDDKDRHRRDRDKHKRDRDRHRSRDSKEREHRGGEHRSERRDKLSQDSGKEEGSTDSICDSSGNQTLNESPAINTPGTISPIVSPGRRNPKPRLSLEEKLFQRELEVVLELSKEDLNKTSVTAEHKEHVLTTEATTLNEKIETQSTTPLEHSTGGDCSIPAQSIEPTVEASVPEKLSEPECVKEEEEFVQTPDPTPTPPPALPNCKVTMEPLPSTSTGKTAKRIRKTVVFKEDSDSDFDGFGNDVGAESEESDFMPSPKKKKKSKESKKTRNTRQTKTSTQKPPSKSIDQERTLVLSPRSHPALAKENTAPTNNATTPPPSPVASLKITTSPELKASPFRSTSASLKVTISPELKASPRLHSPPPVKTTTTKTKVTKPIRSASATTSSSPSGVTLSPSVKTPFRTPSSVSPNSGPLSSPASSMGAKTLYRGTGLRLGLSRSANLKPLHPNIARRISD